MRKSYLFVGFSMFVGLLACGDDEGGGNSSASESIAQSCARICSRSSAAKCPGDVASTCQSECVDTSTNLIPKACSSQLQATQDCALKASFMCDAEGSAQPVGCDAQISALQTCVVNNANGPGPVTGNDAGGGTQTGNDAGVTTPGNDAGGGSDAGIDFGDLLCKPAPDDDACDTCSKNNCCDLLKDCGTDCQAVTECINACIDETCLSTCMQKYAAGWQQLLVIGECYQTECATECEDDTTVDNCLPGTAIDPEYCPLATMPVLHECATKPVGCTESPTGADDVYCCAK